MKPQKRKSPRDTCDTRDTRQAKTPAIRYPPPYKMHEQKGTGAIGSIRRIKISKQMPNFMSIAKGLEQLALHAESDSPLNFIAQGQLLDLASDLVHRINRLATAKPEQWREHSEGASSWPVNASLHPYMIKGMEPSAQLRDFLENTLHLGRQLVPITDINSKWKVTSPITREAISLVGHVWKARNAAYFCRTQNLEIADGWRKTAGDLPEWNKDSAKKWATVAEQAFLESYPNPEQIQELADEIGAHREDGITAEFMSPGKLRDRILHRLSKAICDNAPK